MTPPRVPADDGTRSKSPPLEVLPVADSAASRTEQDANYDYRYLEWETPITDLYQYPERLPTSVTKFQNPFDWSKTHKNVILALSCFECTAAAYASGAYVSGIDQMQDEWKVSRVALLVGVTLFTAGFAVAPMFLAPFTEVYGRRHVFLATYILFCVCHLACALCHSFPGMLVARFWLGVAGSTFSTIVGGVIADIFETHERGFPMSCFAAAALMGTGLGPLISGFIAENTTWRWIHFVQLIFNCIGLVIVFFLLKETRGTVLLSRRAAALNKFLDEVEDQEENVDEEKKKPSELRVRWKCRADAERDSISILIKISLTRPFHLLFTESVVFWHSMWVTFSWGVLYLFLQGVPLVFQTSFNFTLSQTGLVFIAMIVGALLGLFLNHLVETFAPRFFPLTAQTPEGRLYASCTLGCLLPIGMFWFGWTSFPTQHWILPAIAVGCTTIGIYSIYLAVFNYLVDVYKKYASSALAAQSFCRNIVGGCFPLITNLMYKRMTFQGASSFLGGMAALLSIVPWVLVFYGTRIRKRSSFAKDMD